jgi:hypothetical protein
MPEFPVAVRRAPPGFKKPGIFVLLLAKPGNPFAYLSAVSPHSTMAIRNSPEALL